MGVRYLNLVRQGQNQWWRYLLGIIIILGFWFIIGAVFYLIPITLGGGLSYFTSEAPQSGSGTLSMENFIRSVPPILSFVGTFLTFVPLFVALFLVVRVIHNRPFRTLVTPEKGVNWRRIAQAFFVFGALLALLTVLEALLYPGRYQFTLNVGKFLPFLVAGLILIPLQTSSEELLFRGYLMQGASLLVSNPILLAVLSGLIFTLPHLANPELSAGFWLIAPQYFIVGFVLAFITLRDNSLELALGVHAANNVFVGLIATFPDSAIQGETIFASSTLDPVYSLFSVIVAYGGFCLIMCGRRKQQLEE
jgi:membrane protease YdiL (CAAX protease family)